MHLYEGVGGSSPRRALLFLSSTPARCRDRAPRISIPARQPRGITSTMQDAECYGPDWGVSCLEGAIQDVKGRQTGRRVRTRVIGITREPTGSAAVAWAG